MGEFEIITGFLSTTGGVMTVEVGAVTGELLLTTRAIASDRRRRSEPVVEALVSYAGAKDLYTVAGSPVPMGECTHEQVHWDIIERLETPFGGSVGFSGASGINEPPTDLRE